MRALVWHGKEDIRCDTVSDPQIQDARDAIVKVTSCAICGSDLHLFHNFVPAMLPGDIMGHEMMGEVVEVEAQGKGTRVTADAIYVLTKTISRVFKGGQPGEALDHEMMSFTSAEIGRFRKGTSCIATGKLEDLATQGLKKVTALPSGGAEPAPAAEPPTAPAP